MRRCPGQTYLAPRMLRWGQAVKGAGKARPPPSLLSRNLTTIARHRDGIALHLTFKQHQSLGPLTMADKTPEKTTATSPSPAAKSQSPATSPSQGAMSPSPAELGPSTPAEAIPAEDRPEVRCGTRYCPSYFLTSLAGCARDGRYRVRARRISQAVHCVLDLEHAPIPDAPRSALPQRCRRCILLVMTSEARLWVYLGLTSTHLKGSQ